MKELIVNFVYMFLLVKDKSAPVVLLPRGAKGREHETKLKFANKTLTLTQADVTFVERKIGTTSYEAIKGGASTWPDRRLLLQIDEVPSKKQTSSSVTKATLATQVPSTLNARIALPKGDFVALGAFKGGTASRLRWLVSHPDAKTEVRQCLSDQMQFTRSLKDGFEYALLIDGQPPFDLQPNASGNIEITFTNDDVVTGSMTTDDTGNKVLDEYDDMFALLADSSDRRPPRLIVTTGSGSGVDKPICGGGGTGG